MIRDHIEGFEITDDTLQRRSNEAGALNYLFTGMGFLYDLVRQAELEARQQFIDVTASAETRLPSVAPVHPGVRICAFHWYATSACNFVKTIAWIHQRQDSSAPSPADYLEKVVPEVKSWRDKVSAHFAFHTPHRNDTPADGLASVIPPTAQINGRFVAGAYCVTVTRAGQRSNSQLRPWSLTEVHERLCTRYGISAQPSKPAEPGAAPDTTRHPGSSGL
jgi:hypothetical protein